MTLQQRTPIATGLDGLSRSTVAVFSPFRFVVVRTRNHATTRFRFVREDLHRATGRTELGHFCDEDVVDEEIRVSLT
ncbi:hypothetical protein ZHAS_00012962 [Anopheles sinensis]|uniref:Uncharacterized protein n=1 Tax=Anopheles sinensis TaxID=74873 RepID=A0A084W479_ANOSI|nr:hypothetical protein ZHAS_00012962 [Anopheles sinensis]